MNIGLIKHGETVIIDANIIVYAIQGESESCKKFLLRCANDELNGILPVHILAEIMHVLMLAEARDNDWIKGGNSAGQLSDKPERIRQLYRYENLIKDLLSIDLQIVPVEKVDFMTALRIQRETGLMTNDALLAAVADRLRIQAIASSDKALTRLSGKIIYQPEDVRG